MVRPLAACLMVWAILVLGLHGASMASASAGMAATCADQAASGPHAEQPMCHDGETGHAGQASHTGACCDWLCMSGFVLPAEWLAHPAWQDRRVPPAAGRIADGLRPPCPLRPPNGSRAA